MPSISVARRNPETQRGWKDTHVGGIQSLCGSFEGPIDQCIDEKTYKLSETINDILGTGEYQKCEKSLLNASQGPTTEFGKTPEGRYYTWSVPMKTGPSNQTYFSFSFDLVLHIFIHDPKYFLFSYNPSYGHIMKIVDPNTTSNHYNNLIMTEHTGWIE